MRFEFKTKKLEDLYEKEKYAHKYPQEVIEAFFDAISVIQAAKDIRDLYQLKGLHFEKLKADRKDERSIRLNDQWRLTMKLKKDKHGNYLQILNIKDYHS
ncbi:MAG: type II toxin-antitoxin system RelE/ParE family toxin [Anaerolineales bacterium]|nr:type II toxin-antitoxin system RelE/ParE family toxin [Anaerolineales bacterium]